MAAGEIRPIVKMRSTAGTGYTYVTRKNRRNDPDRLGAAQVRPRSAPARRVPGGALSGACGANIDSDGEAVEDRQERTAARRRGCGAAPAAEGRERDLD